MPTLPLDRPGPLDPPPAYAQLRPVSRVRTPQGTPAWLVTGFDAAVAVLTDTRFGLTPHGGGYGGNDTLSQDGVAHTRLRRLVGRAFTPGRIAAMGERSEKLAAGYVDAMLDRGPPADLVADLAAPLSITVIGELLGVDERERFRGWPTARCCRLGTRRRWRQRGWRCSRWRASSWRPSAIARARTC